MFSVRLPRESISTASIYFSSTPYLDTGNFICGIFSSHALKTCSLLGLNRRGEDTAEEGSQKAVCGLSGCFQARSESPHPRGPCSGISPPEAPQLFKAYIRWGKLL